MCQPAGRLLLAGAHARIMQLHVVHVSTSALPPACDVLQCLCTSMAAHSHHLLSHECLQPWRNARTKTREAELEVAYAKIALARAERKAQHAEKLKGVAQEAAAVEAEVPSCIHVGCHKHLALTARYHVPSFQKLRSSRAWLRGLLAPRPRCPLICC